MKKQIPLEKKNYGNVTTIRKTKFADGKPMWVVTYPRMDVRKYVTIVIDGAYGTVLRETQRYFGIEE